MKKKKFKFSFSFVNWGSLDRIVFDCNGMRCMGWIRSFEQLRAHWSFVTWIGRIWRWLRSRLRRPSRLPCKWKILPPKLPSINLRQQCAQRSVRFMLFSQAFAHFRLHWTIETVCVPLAERLRLTFNENIFFLFKAPANYKFGYAVKDLHTGDDKQAWEHRHGDQVKGSYRYLINLRSH